MLCRASLAYLVLYNRRRVGETQKLLMTTYLERNKQSLSSDLFQGLSEFEKTLASTHERIEVRGKRGRKVAILLPELLVSALDQLVAKRREVGVAEGNGFLFARPNFGSLEHQSAGECLREAIAGSKCKHPEWITSTKLRKQVATHLQLLDLNENEQDLVADILGHDIRIHRQYYRLPEGTLQLAKVTKLLLAMEKGKLPKFGGKKLEDIKESDIGMWIRWF